MKRIVASPFLCAPETSVRHEGWRIKSTHESTALPDQLENWDYLTCLDLSCTVSVRAREVLEQCQLGPASRLSLVVTARSDHTNVEELMAAEEVDPEGPEPVTLSFELPGQNFGGRLTLLTVLVVCDPDPAGDLAPRERGSVIWKDNFNCYLQGDSAQFPTIYSSFSEGPWGKAAAWSLDIELDNPEARFSQATRLVLNSDSPLVMQLNGDPGLASVQRVRQVLRWDVTRQMALAALRCEDALEAEIDFDATSVAGVLRNLLERVWPGIQPSTIRDWHVNDLARFETGIQDHCGFGS